MKHLTEEELILHHYGEATGRSDAASHLAGCEHCQAELRALQNVLAAVSAAPTPARHENFGAEIWRLIEPELVKERRSHPRYPLAWWPQWAMAMAALALAAFLVGRLSNDPKENPVQTVANLPSKPAADGSVRILLSEISEHLERSQVALIDLLNSKADGPVDLSSEKVLARELVAMNRLYRRASAENGEAATATMLDELERSLVEVANAPAQLNAEEFAELRQRVGGDSLIFKVRIVAQQLRAREKSLVQQNTRRSPKI
jgi:hypothetical protein